MAALTDLAPIFDSMKQSTEGLIASFRQFSLSSSQFESTLSSMNAVAGKFAVESSDIISAVQRAGGAFKLSAGDMKSESEALNEFMALFTSVRATTRESADSIATGLRTVFTRFQRADTVKALGDLGINLRYTREEARALGQTNLTDQFVGAYEPYVACRRASKGSARPTLVIRRWSNSSAATGRFRASCPF
ncbi:Phage-related minor tail protein [Gemmata obscuriglobus]|uniref:phage tail tape measure protein n=1 Tax=Gemmata obscuriglobus TaxID=114 RepID=UPI0004962EA9